MINFKFVQNQFKNVWIMILAFGLTVAVLVGIGTISPAFGDMGVKTENGDAILHSGAYTLLNNSLFNYEGLVIFFSFGISMSITLINKDISRGYIASWLTTPMSRTSIFNSKLFTLISSTLLINFWMIILELVLFGIRMQDFSAVIGSLLLGNLGFIFLSLMAVSIPWIIFSLFQKNGLAVGISLGIIGWFTLCSVLDQMHTTAPDLENLKYFKYFTIGSLFNNPLQFDGLPADWFNDPNPHTTIGKINSLNAWDYAWQYPLMFGIGISCFTGGQMIVKRKDFTF